MSNFQVSSEDEVWLVVTEDEDLDDAGESGEWISARSDTVVEVLR